MIKYKATVLLIAGLQILHSASTLRKWNGPNYDKIWKNDNEVTNLRIKYGVSNLQDHNINLEIKTISSNHGAHKKLLRDYDYDFTQQDFKFSPRNNDEIYVQNQVDAIVKQRISDPSIIRTYPYDSSTHSSYNTPKNYLLGPYDQILRHNTHSQNSKIHSALNQPTKNDYEHYIPSNGNITVTEPYEDTVISTHNAEDQNPDYPALRNNRHYRAEDDYNDDQVSTNIKAPQHPSDQNKVETDSLEIDDNYLVLSPYEQPPIKVSKEEYERPSEVIESSKKHDHKNISSPHDYDYYDMDLYQDIITPFEDFNHSNMSKYSNGTGLGWLEIYTQQSTPYLPHLYPHQQPVSSQYNPPPKHPYPYQVPPRNIQNPHYPYQPQPPQISQVAQRPAHPPFDPNDPYNPVSNSHDNIYKPMAPYPPPRNVPYQPPTGPLSTVLNLSPNIHTDEDDCEYGTSWTMNCYHCVCNGPTATCIRDNNCKPPPSYAQNEPKLCKPFTQFPLDGSDCHRCQCTADGIPLCTFDYYACSRKTKQRFYKLQGENTLKIGLSLLNNSLSTTTRTCPALLMYFNVWKCQPGSRWYARCFNCACDDFGQPICYRIVGCTPAPLSMPPKCRPGTTIPMKDCIDCYCDDDGFPAGQLPPPKSSGLSGTGAVVKGKESSKSKEKAGSGVDSSEESEETVLGKDVSSL